MPNSYYNQSGAPSQGSSGSSAVIRAEFLAIVAGFDKLPTLGGNAGQVVVVNGGATGLTTSSALTFSGSDVSIGGALSLSNGSAAAPSLRFANSLTTGLYRAGADQIGVAIAGVNAGTWSASALALVGGLSVAGVAGFASGSAAAPSLSLSASPTSGFYRAGADQIGVAIAGANAATWSSTGLSAVGNLTSTASVGLRNSTANGTDAGVQLSQASQRTWQLYTPASSTDLRIRDVTGAIDVVRIAAGGDIGVNCSPVGTSPLRIQTAGSNDAGIEFFRDSATRFRQQFYNRAGGSYVDAQFDALTYRFSTSGTQRWSMDGSGHWLPSTNEAFNIGGSATNQVLAIYARSLNNDNASTLTISAGNAGGSIDFRQGGSSRADITTAGVFRYGGIEIGYRGLPAASVTSGAFAATDAGKCVYATAGVTIPNSTMAATDVVVIQNTTGSAITITKSITTAYDTATGSAIGATFSLPARARCVLVFTSSTECYKS